MAGFCMALFWFILMWLSQTIPCARWQDFCMARLCFILMRPFALPQKKAICFIVLFI